VSLTVGMPEMAAGGLSEAWLFKHCGAAHWNELCARTGRASRELADETGARIYPTFVAVRGRYSVPLAAVGENDCFETAIQLAHYGRSFFLSRVALTGRPGAFELEMLSAFVARESAGRNQLRKSTPAPEVAYDCAALKEPPAILKRARERRRGEDGSHQVGGRTVDLRRSGLGLAAEYEPSPYLDFNGANLLYFASYPAMADTLERRMVRTAHLEPDERDWALSTSTVARDVFYYRNLDLGRTVQARLNQLAREGQSIVIHTTLVGGQDGEPLADVFTEKKILG
jgi:probable biosynthetic protein (TIGR04098 family)